MVVVAAGVRPNTQVAAENGLTVERSIVADDQMRAAGEDGIYVADPLP